VTRILPKEVVAAWEVHPLWEILLPTATQVLGYSEKPVKQID
jgi:hypothetical protein